MASSRSRHTFTARQSTSVIRGCVFILRLEPVYGSNIAGTNATKGGCNSE